MDDVSAVIDEIRSRYGYDLRGYEPEHVRRRLHTALARSGLASLDALRARIADDAAFFQELIGSLFIQVSELFREPAMFRRLRTDVVPILRTYPLIRIWLCGCARGEEVYSMAILLQEEGLSARSQIYATDVSPKAISDARAGVYPRSSLEQYERNYAEAGGRARLEDYCTAGGDRIAMHESLRENVVFFHHDLVCDHVFGEMHLVFCRNVLIYFGPDLRAASLAKLVASLCPGGFLCLGSSESILPQDGAPLRRLAGAERVFRQVDPGSA